MGKPYIGKLLPIIVGAVLVACPGCSENRAPATSKPSPSQTSPTASSPRQVTASRVLTSPFADGVSGFVIMGEFKSQWTRLEKTNAKLSQQMLQALGPGLPVVQGLSGAGDLGFFLGPELVVKLSGGDASKLGFLGNQRGKKGDLHYRRLGKEIYVGSAKAMASLPQTSARRVVPASDLAALEKGAFVGVLWHEEGRQLATLSVTGQGSVMRIYVPGQAPEEMQQGLQRTAADSGVALSIKPAENGGTRLVFKGEPFSTLGLAIAIFIPMVMKYRKRARE